MPTMPLDSNNKPIPALTLKPSGAHAIAFTDSSARNSTAFDAEVISLYATEDCYVKLGDNTVAATTGDHFFPAGVYYDIALRGKTHIAAIRDSVSGTLYVSEKV